MQRLVYGILAVAAVIVAGIFSCTSQSSNGPRPGETVMPSLSDGLHWTAGHPGRIGARLLATGPEGARSRSLDFIPGVSANPVATITFFNGEQPVSSAIEVVLSHRC